MPDYGTLSVSEVILHRVPAGRRADDGPDPIEYAEAPIEFGNLDRGFIENRLRETLGGMARPVIQDDEEESRTPDIVRSLLAGNGDIVADSSELARALHRKQKWMSSVGLVMLIRGQLSGEPCLVIAKMEHEEGMRVEPTVIRGKRTYRAQYLKDLILGQATKVFKVGVFVASGAQADMALAGHVVDEQQGGGGVADYFVEFLGCKFVLRPDVLTERFFKITQSYANRLAKGDAETTAEYEIGLLAEMQNQSRRVSPEQFAQRYLKSEHQSDYLGKIEEAGVPVKGFTKDTSLITSSIRRVKIQTGRGASIFVPPPMYEDGSVSVDAVDGGGDSQIVVRDRISSISGASGSKATENSE